MSLKRQTLWIMAPLLVVTVLNLFSVRLFNDYLGKPMYALWLYVSTFSGLFGFADLGLGSAVGRYMGIALGKNDPQAAREYWGTGNLIVLPLLALTALVFAGTGTLLGPKLFESLKPEHVTLFRWCFVSTAVSLFLSYYNQLWQILLQVHLNFRFIGISKTVVTVCQVIPSLVLAWYTGNPLIVILWGLGVSVAHLLVYIWYARRYYQQGLDFRFASLARAKEMAGYTSKIFVSLISSGFLGTIDRLILGKVAPKSDAFLHYSIATNAGSRLQGLGVSVMPPVFHNTSFAVGRGSQTTPGEIYRELFEFTFGWYVLASIWVAIWHPAALRLWLGPNLAADIAPIFTPLIIAYCLGGMASVSGSQLNALDRAGAGLGFSIAVGALAAAGAYIGWQVGGLVGVAWGFLVSRLVYIAQDIYTGRLVGAAGWLNPKLWLGLLLQLLVGGAFALVYLVLPGTSYWMLIPATLHGGLVAAWLLRHPLRRGLGKFFKSGSPSEASANKGTAPS